MKTEIICIVIAVSVILLLILLSIKPEKYNAIPPIWNWKEENSDKEKRKCMAKPGKVFYQS
jgi:hypothetical protein